MGKIIVTTPCTGKTFILSKNLQHPNLCDDGVVMKAFHKQHPEEFINTFESGIHKIPETYDFTLTDPSYYGYFDFAMQMANHHSSKIFFLVGPFNFIKDKTIDTLPAYDKCKFAVWIPTDEELFFNWKCRKIELQGTELHYYEFPLLMKIKERITETAKLYNWPIYDSFRTLLAHIND
jgi:hypothetical protein